MGTVRDTLKKLVYGTESINELSSLVKKVRNCGLIGINTYFKPLEKLYNHLVYLGLASMKEIDEEVIVDFLTSATAGLSDASKKNYRIAMINFFSFIDKNNEEDGKSYVYGIELKNWGGIKGKSGQKLPEFMKEEEIKKFIEALERFPFRKNTECKNRLIIKIILYTGIRVSEAINLRKKDIFKENGTYFLRIIGKGNKTRVAMIHSRHIEKELECLKETICENDLLFCNKKGKKFTQAYISRNVEKVLLSAGIKKEKNGAHMLRHSYATLLYLKSKDLILVQEALGHASLNTSRIYTHFDKERLKKATEIVDNLTK
jgi:integrase/recombinase XerD